MSAESSTPKGAFKVGAGIFLSRISGLVRDRVLAHYLGNSAANDAFRAALRIPNILQNLFGEGVLSASFIPVYAHLLAKGDRDQAQKVAGAILSWLFLLVALFVWLGVSFTPQLIDIIAPGFSDERRQLAIQLVQIFFPGTGILVLAAWCLGILNSHRHFFIPYVAPVLCNVATIAAVYFFSNHNSQEQLAVQAAWGFVVGTGLQWMVQIPTTWKLLGSLRLGLGRGNAAVSTVLKNFGPVVVARGVVQISAYIDTWLASLLPIGALSALAYAQTLYVLPVSLFGMSISASQLPAMSSHLGSHDEVAQALRQQLEAGLRRIVFLVVPSVVAFIALGDVIVGSIYQSGQFQSADTHYVWMVLAGYSLGLLAATMGRLYSSTYYALRDTRRPLLFALLRVISATVLGYTGALILVPHLTNQLQLGTIALTLASGLSGWLEYFLLKRTLRQRIGSVHLPFSFFAKVWGAAAVAGSTAVLIKWLWPLHPLLAAFTVLGPYGIIYLSVTHGLGVSEARAWTRKLLRART